MEIALQHDQAIYRIVHINHFMDMAYGKYNELSRPSNWDDPFENFYFQNKVSVSQGQAPISLDDVRERYFCQCWSLIEDSDAMWRIYSKERMGIRIKTTVGELLGQVQSITNKDNSAISGIRKVVYVDEVEIMEAAIMSLKDFSRTPDGPDSSLLMKRKAFEHEQEIRLIYFDEAGTFKGASKMTLGINWKIVIDEIAIDPRLNDNALKWMKAAFASAGFSKKIVVRSRLYQPFRPNTVSLD